jgi:hypothetical protein
LAAYAVKHIAEEQGPLLANLKTIRKTPHSYTSREPEASEAAAGGDVYVVEVRKDKAVRTYWLGYKYQAKEKYAPAGGGVWKGGFRFRNSSTPGDRADGVYFEVLPQITDATLCEWLSTQTPMAVMPQPIVDQLEAMIDTHAEMARYYA